MTMQWFKLHHEIIHDIKLRRFSAVEKWAWITLLCLASQSSTRGKIEADDEDIADICEFNNTQDWLYFKDKLKSKGMIEFVDGGMAIANWERRQYDKPSDKPEATKIRKQQQRQRQKEQQQAGVTPLSRQVTPSHAIDTDKTRSEETRSDQIRSEPLPSFQSGSPEGSSEPSVRSVVAQQEPEPTHPPTPVNSDRQPQLATTKVATPPSTAVESKPQSRYVSSAERCDRMFQALPAWKVSNKPLDFVPEFIRHLQNVYLPSVPSYRDRGVPIDVAQSWLSKADFDEERMRQACIQWAAFERLQSAAASSSTTNKSNWDNHPHREEWIAQLRSQGLYQFCGLMSGSEDEEKREFGIYAKEKGWA